MKKNAKKFRELNQEELAATSGAGCGGRRRRCHVKVRHVMWQAPPVMPYPVANAVTPPGALPVLGPAPVAQPLHPATQELAVRSPTGSGNTGMPV